MHATREHVVGLFQSALGIEEPWYVSEYQFDSESGRLGLNIDFRKGSRFICPVCGAEGAEPYDTKERTWRHLNFFQHQTSLTARIPRVQCIAPSCGMVKTVNPPWAAQGSHFTMLFEAFIMVLAAEMPVKAIADMVGEYDQRIWKIIDRNVEQALAKEDYSNVAQIGIDETSSKRGHNYITVVVDLDQRKAIFATEGKDASTVDRFADHLIKHKGDPKNIKAVSSDMSLAFISGITKNFPDADLVFDRFHIMKLMGDAVDNVRREESKETDALKKTRYLWLSNPKNLNADQTEKLSSLTKLNLKTARAYRLKLALAEFFEQEDYSSAEAHLKSWYYWATHSRLEPIIKAAKTIKKHWEGVMAWYIKPINNGILEGFNSLIQAAKARARGYRTTKNLITMVYLVAGKLNFDLERVYLEAMQKASKPASTA
ncbi:MAG: ISL3 family transposase [Limnochordia bacterium]|jgi:transposase